MAKSVKLRQGTDTEHAAFTGEMAEVTFDTTNNTIILHDGTTAGGIPMAKLSDVPVDLTDLTDVDGNLVGEGTAFSGTTYVVTVASGTNAYSTGNKYYITDLADASPTVTLTEGVTYRFDQSDSTNTGHPLKFSTTADGTHDSGIEYTTGVTYNGVPGQADAYTEITVEVGAPTLYYYCAFHSGMGDAPAPAATPMWSLSGDSGSFAAVSDSKLDTSAASYVALNHPSGRGNTWALEDGSYALRNNSNSVNDPGTRPLHIWSTDDLSDGMTTQYWIKFDANQPAMWEALHGVEAGSSQAHSYSILLAYAVHTLAWAGNGAYGYFGHTSNGSSSFPDQGWLHIAEELQSNGRQVIYINGVVVVNESASDLFGLTNKANLRIGSVSSWMTDIEVYTGGGIHNPDLLETPPGFTPPARKTAPPPIVTSSLVWHVDAANPSSYSGSGSTWSDLIGSEDVDLIGSPTYSADEGGGAFNFVAGSSYGKTSFTRTNDDFSVSAWYKPNDPQLANQGYYNLMNTFESSSAEWWSLSLLGPSPRPFWVCDNDSAKIELWADGGTVNSTWQMITGTRSGNTMKIYVNGTLQGTSTALTSSAISGVEPIWIASRSNEDTGSPSETYGGWISDLKMYSKELSDSEVLQNYNALKDRYT